MERRSPPQKRIDDHAFPVRVKVLVPERGFENLLLDMHCWLDAEVGRGSYAEHGARTGLTDATAWYFRSVEAAQAFVARFPMLELADGTELPTYQRMARPVCKRVEHSAFRSASTYPASERTPCQDGDTRGALLIIATASLGL